MFGGLTSNKLGGIKIVIFCVLISTSTEVSEDIWFIFNFLLKCCKKLH